MASISNALRSDRFQRYFVHGEIEAALEPPLEMEEFTSAP